MLRKEQGEKAKDLLYKTDLIIRDISKLDWSADARLNFARDLYTASLKFRIIFNAATKGMATTKELEEAEMGLLKRIGSTLGKLNGEAEKKFRKANDETSAAAEVANEGTKELDDAFDVLEKEFDSHMELSDDEDTVDTEEDKKDDENEKEIDEERTETPGNHCEGDSCCGNCSCGTSETNEKAAENTIVGSFIVTCSIVDDVDDVDDDEELDDEDLVHTLDDEDDEYDEYDDDELEYDEDELDDDEEEEKINELDNELSSLITEKVSLLWQKTEDHNDDCYFYKKDEDSEFELYSILDGVTNIELRSVKTGQKASQEVVLSFLNEETDYYTDYEELLVFNEDCGNVERVTVFDEIETNIADLEVYLIARSTRELRLVARYCDNKYFRYLLGNNGEFSEWVEEELGGWVEDDDFIVNLAGEVVGLIAMDIPELDSDNITKLASIGSMLPIIVQANEIKKQRIKDAAREAEQKRGRIQVDKDMSRKNIDDIKAANGNIGNGKRYLILDAPRHNDYIAYVDPEGERTNEGGLPIKFATIIHEDREERYDDYEIKVLPVHRYAKQTVILDSQVVRELTDYMQMTEDTDFIVDLISLISEKNASIVSGVRRPLVLIPDMGTDKIVLAYKRINSWGNIQTELHRFNVRDYRRVAGGSFGMGAHIDLDILGGYVDDRSK